jgi:uncharacterized protein YhbP (UPF0306 family)
MADLPQSVLDYLQQQKTVTLATASPEGEPHASTFMYANDGVALYVWARQTSTTAQHLERNPRVGFAIDEYVEDWNKAKGIQGRGECQSVVDGDEIGRAIGLFADKFPSPSSGASTTSISFYRIRPSELQFIDNSGASIHLGEEEFGVAFHREQVFSSSDRAGA